MLATEQKTRREAALEKALAALLKVTHPSKDVVADMLISLIMAEGREADTSALRKALHVELVRMGLPMEVLAALRGT